jgi:hypothetical protein
MLHHIKFSHVLCACLALAAFPSCSDDDDDAKLPEGDYILFTDSNTKIYKSIPNTYYAGITFTTSGAWTAKLNREIGEYPDRWLEITPMQGDTAGVYSLKIHIQENTTDSDRKAALVVTCGEATQTFYLLQRSEDSDYAQ